MLNIFLRQARFLPENEIILFAGENTAENRKDDRKIAGNIYQETGKFFCAARIQQQKISQVILRLTEASRATKEFFAPPAHPVGQKTLFSVRLTNKK